MLNNNNKSNYYITTAINYTNGSPHLGHAYEAVITDVLARYHRNLGVDVFFLTGTDEHGLKIARSAEKEGLTPKELCEKYSGIFKKTDCELNISYDRFIRTTDLDHIETCKLIWHRVKENGDIYLSHYEGWYNVKEEEFVTDTEAEKMNFLDSSGSPLINTSEPSYFFRLSKYQKDIINHINNHPEFIQPPELRNSILVRLKDPLRDLSISRTSFDWGIQVPDDDEHVIYVWFDALINYLSGINIFQDDNSYYWPASTHIIGKDIIWFHSVIWPAILLSLNFPLPQTIFGHGFVLDKNGYKMSKSVGNVISPDEVLSTFSSDTIRYFFCRESYIGSDFKWNDESVKARYDGELVDKLGSLTGRILALVLNGKFGIENEVPDGDIEEIFNIEKLINDYVTEFEIYRINRAIELALTSCKKVSAYLSETKPWEIVGPEAPHKIKSIIRTCLESLYIIAHLFDPVIPESTAKIFSALGKSKTLLFDLTWNNLQTGAKIEGFGYLFPRIRDTRFEKNTKD